MQVQERFVICSKRVRGGGFLKTLLLRRVGSSMEAGRNTALKMLGTWEDIFDEDGLEEEEVYDTESKTEVKTLTPKERDCLERFIATLEANKDNDPKYNHVLRLLVDENWIERGCIIFSQYYPRIGWEMFSAICQPKDWFGRAAKVRRSLTGLREDLKKRSKLWLSIEN